MKTSLEQYIRSKKIPISAFAADSGLSVQAIYKLMNGERFPRHSTLRKIEASTNGQVNLSNWQNPPPN